MANEPRENFNIQVNIQRVQEETVPTGQRAGMQQAISGKERVVTEVLKLAVTADTEQEAYNKAHRLLAANAGELK